MTTRFYGDIMLIHNLQYCEVLEQPDATLGPENVQKTWHTTAKGCMTCCNCRTDTVIGSNLDEVMRHGQLSALHATTLAA
jgi:hypothetical protein